MIFYMLYFILNILNPPDGQLLFVFQQQYLLKNFLLQFIQVQLVTDEFVSYQKL